MVYSDGMSGSSSFLDKGVRLKFIQYRSLGCWDFLPIPDPTGEIERKSRQWMVAHDGDLYDTRGNLMFAFGRWVRDAPNKQFCSESCVASVGVPRAYTYGPTDAAEVVRWHLKCPSIILMDGPGISIGH